MRRIAVINQKGGVGKTTTTANLGAALGRSGRRTLLVDLDPQAHLSLHFGVELGDDEPSVYDVLTAAMPIRDIARDVRNNITLVPSDIDLAGAETELVSVTGREFLLREALEPLGDGHDCLMIDCPPSLGVLTINALVAADEVLIPLQAHFLALQGLGKLLDTVTLVRQRINPELKVCGIVLCMHESTTRLAGEVVEDLARFLSAARGTDVPWADAVIYETCIRRNIKLAESASFGQTVFDYAPRCNGTADYARLAVDIFGETLLTSDAETERLSTVNDLARLGTETSKRVRVEDPPANEALAARMAPAEDALTTPEGTEPVDPTEPPSDARTDPVDLAPAVRPWGE